MKSIKEWQHKSWYNNIGKYFRLGWTFEKWYEKLILVILCLFGFWKIIGFAG